MRAIAAAITQARNTSAGLVTVVSKAMSREQRQRPQRAALIVLLAGAVLGAGAVMVPVAVRAHRRARLARAADAAELASIVSDRMESEETMPIIDLLPLSSRIDQHGSGDASNDGTAARETDTQGVSHGAELRWATETHSMKGAESTSKSKSRLSEHDMLML